MLMSLRHNFAPYVPRTKHDRYRENRCSRSAKKSEQVLTFFVENVTELARPLPLTSLSLCSVYRLKLRAENHTCLILPASSKIDLLAACEDGKALVFSL
jgi:hypothetical protein